MTKAERCRMAYVHDLQLWESGLVFAGIDEAGRGPLAGCVMAACVVMKREPLIRNILDSKQLSAGQRAEAYAAITENAAFWGVGRVEAAEIDRINILEATKLAMRRAAEGAPATLFLVDAVTRVGLQGNERPIIGGDAVSYAIAAASIVAKHTRDLDMLRLDSLYPQYGFAQHKGYGTALHIEALKRHGPCAEHRMSFLGRILS